MTTPTTPGEVVLWNRLVAALALRLDNDVMTEAEVEAVWSLALPLAADPPDLLALCLLCEQVEAGGHDRGAL